MSARRQMAMMGGFLAALVVLLLVGLLVLDRSRPRWGAAGIVPPPVPGEALRRGAPPRSTGPGTGETEDGPAAGSDPEEEREEAALPEVREIPGRAVTEEGRLPLAGVSFLDAERRPGGDVQPFLEPGPDDDLESDADGRFILRWARPQEEVLFFVVDADSTVVAVEGGEVVEDLGSSTVVRALPGTGPLVLILGPRAGYASVRLVDAEDGTVVSGREGVTLRWAATFDRIPPQAQTWPKKADAAGWIPALTPSWHGFRGAGPSDPLTVTLEILADGYEVERIPRERVRGRLVVPLRRASASIRGEVRLPDEPSSTRSRQVQAIVRPRDAGAATGVPPVRGLPSGPGPFEVYDLPDGSWALEVVAFTPRGPRWARRTFEKWGGTADLGVMEVAGHSGLRVRVLDSEGRTLEGVPLSVVRVEDQAGISRDGALQFIDGRATSGGTLVVRSGSVDFLYEPSPEEKALPGGWKEFRGLLPGARYAVTARNIPGVGAEVTTPEGTGQFADVELRWEKRMVHCTLRFTLGGEPLPDTVTLVEAPFLREDWTGSGPVTTDLPPGEQRFRFLVLEKEKKTIRMVEGTLEIPDGTTFEGTVDLK